MSRKSESIPDKGLQIVHYINGKNRDDGVHPGIRKKCPICNGSEWQFGMLSTDQAEYLEMVYEMSKNPSHRTREKRTGSHHK